MDYKELIEPLRDKSNCDVLDYVDDAATAIETLLEERDAAVEDLKGRRGVCKHRRVCLVDEQHRNGCAAGNRGPLGVARPAERRPV